MKKMLSLTTLAVLMTATPALAQGNVVIIGGSGSQSASAAQAPTGYLNIETASVLTSGLSYVSAGGAVGNILPGNTLNFRRGMGGGGELAVNLGVNAGLSPSAFGAGVGAGWKQSLVSNAGMNVAVDGGIALTGLGGANNLQLNVGLPLSFGSNLTIHPRVALPALNAGVGTGFVAAGIGYQAPIAPRWQLLAEVTPTVGFGGGFSLPLGVGGRFSPTATSHIDVTVGTATVTPFTGNIGLVGLTGHVGF